MTKPAMSVQPIHFTDFDGIEFERLVFAYHLRAERWRQIEWYGQTGSDLGRDIWGIRENGTTQGESVCVQCVNRSELTYAKVQRDLSKVLKSIHGVPQRFRIVTRSNVSAKLRDKVKTHSNSLGVAECDIWSGSEFEEFLRHGAESLLKRFIEGEAFPDTPADLKQIAESVDPMDDMKALSLLTRVFDRPAFYTPIHIESNLGDFKQAITDTIAALGTGILKDRDGRLIERIPSRHRLTDAALRQKLQTVEVALAKLRARFDEMSRSHQIRHCGCGDPKCSAYFMPHEAAVELERLRSNVLKGFHQAYPAFDFPAW